MLNKRLLVKTLLSHSDGNAIYGKREGINTEKVSEDAKKDQKKAQPIKFLIVFTFAIAIVVALYFIASYTKSNIETELNLTNEDSARLKTKETTETINSLNGDKGKAKAAQSTTDLKIEKSRANPADQQAQIPVASTTWARADTAQALKAQKRANEQNRELSLEGEKERVARVQLEKSLPRNFTTKQRSLLIGMLRVNPGQVTITAAGNDSEAWNFAQTLAEALDAAGWTVQNVNQATSLNIPVGLTIVVHSVESRPPPAGLLRMSLNDIGFETSWLIDQKIQTGTILLLVGGRP